jgi:HK97 family phage portal protein
VARYYVNRDGTSSRGSPVDPVRGSAEDPVLNGELLVLRTKVAEMEEQMLERVEPLEGTNISLFNTQIPNWWGQNGLLAGQNWIPGTAELAERVWVAERSIQLNSQQIAAMPLHIEGTVEEPAWLSSPDPNWFPNGIGDAIFKTVSQIYGWGYSCLHVLDRYANGYPRTWTVLDSDAVEIKQEDGRRVYKLGETRLDARDVVQIDRNPGRLKGTPALRAYAQKAWGLMAAGNQSMTVSGGGVPMAVLKPQKKITAEQAANLQQQWATATANRAGLPPVLPPDLDFETLSFDPKDLALLDTQRFDALAVSGAFGVPGFMHNLPLEGALVYQNPQALGEFWWRFELRTTAKRIADAFTAQLLPAGQSVWFDAADTILPLDEMSSEDDPQRSQVAKASPAQQTAPKLAAIGGTP